MKSFEQILTESEEDVIRKNLGLGKEYAFFYKNKWVIDTIHSLHREKDKERLVIPKDIEDLFKKAIDWILKNSAPAKNTEYMFISKSTFNAAILAHKQDEKHRVKGNILSIVTLFGDIRKMGKKNINDLKISKAKEHNTKKIILETTNGNIEVDYIIELE